MEGLVDVGHDLGSARRGFEEGGGDESGYDDGGCADADAVGEDVFLVEGEPGEGFDYGRSVLA